jgi:flagellar M-ring protein FliF
MVPGVVVGVNVELDSELVHERESVEFDPKKTAAVATRESRKTESSTGPAPGGRPGAVPNGVTHNSGAAVAQVESPKSESEVSDAEQINTVSRNEIRGSKAAYVPNVVKASIRVPQSYFAKVWSESNPPSPGQPPQPPTSAQLQDVEMREKNSIKDAVVALLLEQEAGKDPYTAVVVTTYQDLKTPEPESPTVTAQTTTWLGSNWQTLSMVLLGVVSLVLLRGVVRSGPAPASEAALPVVGEPAAPARVSQAVEMEDEEADAAPRLKGRFKISGPNLRAELAEMVREDPESAAKVLSKWIGELN